MCEERRLRESRFVRACLNMCRDARQVPEQHIFAAQSQRHQRRHRLDHFEAKLPRHIIGKTGCAHFGNGRPAGCDDQVFGGMLDPIRNHAKLRAIMADLGDILAGLDFGGPHLAFRQKHVHDLFGTPVAEQLTQCFLMIFNAIAFDEVDKILR